MANISQITIVNISKNPNVIENVVMGENCSPMAIKIYNNLFKEFHDVFALSYKKIPRVDPSILQHKIKTYENAKHVC